MEVRIVSLVPSVTELLFALGLGPQVVGRTHYCIHPHQMVAGVPSVGGTKGVNLSKIKALRATHVVVNIDENRKEMVESLREFIPHVVVTHPQGPLDNFKLIDELSAIFIGGSDRGYWANPLKDALSAGFLDLGWRLENNNSALCSVAPMAQPPEQRVLYLIWRNPWMSVARDTYISNMLSLIGWRTYPCVLGGDRGAKRYPVLDLDAPVAADWLAGIQRVLLSSEPCSFTDDDVRYWRNRLPQAQVQRVDGELLSWYGNRAVEGLGYLRQLSLGAHRSGSSL